MLTFCTLFDSNYLDKGLVLYESLKNVMTEFNLYILAMDDKCCSILKEQQLKNVVVISLQEFEDEELLEIKKQRSRAEYCWTCTASFIDYVFETYNEVYCTYIDSDLYFYKNPKVLIEEMLHAKASVQIVEHGFGTGRRARKQEKNSGRFCVQFNTFKNDAAGRELLTTWKQQCRNHCSMETNEMGDQKYLSEWPAKYKQVHILKHQGGGVAPWNIARFRSSDKKPGVVIDKKTKQEYDLIFYHFHHLEYLDDETVNINAFKKGLGAEEKLVLQIYIPYLKALEQAKQKLSKEFNFVPMIKSHPGFVKRSKQEKIQAIKSLGVEELFNRLIEKVIYLQGKKKDIISLKDI